MLCFRNHRGGQRGDPRGSHLGPTQLGRTRSPLNGWWVATYKARGVRGRGDGADAQQRVHSRCVSSTVSWNQVLLERLGRGISQTAPQGGLPAPHPHPHPAGADLRGPGHTLGWELPGGEGERAGLPPKGVPSPESSDGPRAVSRCGFCLHPAIQNGSGRPRGRSRLPGARTHRSRRAWTGRPGASAAPGRGEARRALALALGSFLARHAQRGSEFRQRRGKGGGGGGTAGQVVKEEPAVRVATQVPLTSAPHPPWIGVVFFFPPVNSCRPRGSQEMSALGMTVLEWHL